MIRRLLILFLLLLPLHAEAVIWVTGTAIGAGNTAAATVTLPGNALNDIILLCVQSDGQTIVAPAGYTEIDDQTKMTTSTSGGVGDTRMAIFWKRSGGSESNPTVADTGDHTVIMAVVVRGVVATGNPWDVETCGFQGTTSTSVSWQSSGIVYGANGGTLTTTVPGTLVLGFMVHGIDIGTAQFTTEALATVNNLTEEVDGGTAIGNGGGFAVWSGIKPAAGVVVDTGSNNFTATLAATSQYAIFIMALKPANSSGPLYIGKGTSSNSTLAITPALDFIYSTNDLLICLVETGGNAIGSTPAGWTQIDSSASMASGADATIGSLRLTILYKRAASSSETAPAVGDSGDHQIGQVLAFTNVITTGNPYDVESVAINATTSTSPDWSNVNQVYGSVGGVVTPTVNNTLVLGIIANGFDSNTSQTSAQNITSTALLTNFNAEITDINTASGTGGGFSVSIGDQLTASTIVNGSSTPTFTATLATTSKYAMAVIALKPPLTGLTTPQKAAFFQLFR